MHKKPWGKFYGLDWLSDPHVRACGLKARGLLADMMALAQNSDGYVINANNGKIIDETVMAKTLQIRARSVAIPLAKLQQSALIARDKRGAFYIPWMVEDAEITKKQRAYGKMGGNPSLKATLNRGLIPRAEQSRAEKKRIHKKGAPRRLNCPSETELRREFNQEIWPHYPDKVGKDKALRCYIRDRRAGATQNEIRLGINRYKIHVANQRATGFEDLHWANGGTWFHNRRWQDEYITTADPPAAGDSLKSAKAAKSTKNEADRQAIQAYAAELRSIKRWRKNADRCPFDLNKANRNLWRRVRTNLGKTARDKVIAAEKALPTR